MVIFIHRYLDSDGIYFKNFSWLFIDPSEHHHIAHISEFNKFFLNRGSTVLNNVLKEIDTYILMIIIGL